jgi:multiple antibiotic resistance protein
MQTSFAHDLIYEFVTLFVILDPIATVPLFLIATTGLARKDALKVAGYAVGVAFLVLLAAIAGGQFLLEALHIPMPAFQLAGSLVLLVFGFKLVLGKLTEEARSMPADYTLFDRAIYPLAIPGIAGAGAILTVVMLTDNNTRSFLEQAQTTGELVLCLVIFFGLYAVATQLFRFLGRSGVEIVSRVFGLVLCSIAVNGLITAIKLSFGLATLTPH